MKAIIWLVAAAVLQSAPAAEQSAPQGLEGAVQAYWDHLLRHQRSQALAFVSDETRPSFLARHEPPFRSWQLSAIEPQEDGFCRVTVVVDRLIQDGFFAWKVREDWIQTEQGWKVNIPDQASARKRVWQTHRPVKPLPGVVDLLPDDLRLHYFSGSQKGTVFVRNGSDEPIRVSGLSYDEERFELVESVEVVAAQSVGRISIRYRGGENEKGLRSELKFRLTTPEGGERAVSVPIAYNVISQAARNLLGLTPEQAQELHKEDKLAPRGAKPPAGN